MVTLGWILRKPLTLLFDPLESIVLFFSGEASFEIIVTLFSTDSVYVKFWPSTTPYKITSRIGSRAWPSCVRIPFSSWDYLAFLRDWWVHYIGLYAIIAVTFWYYPVSELAGIIATCKWYARFAALFFFSNSHLWKHYPLDSSITNIRLAKDSDYLLANTSITTVWLSLLNISPLLVALFCRDRVDGLGACLFHSFLLDLRMHIGAYSYPTEVWYLFAPATSVTFPKDWGQYRLRFCSFLLYANAMSSIIAESCYRVSHHCNIVWLSLALSSSYSPPCVLLHSTSRSLPSASCSCLASSVMRSWGSH